MPTTCLPSGQRLAGFPVIVIRLRPVHLPSHDEYNSFSARALAVNVSPKRSAQRPRRMNACMVFSPTASRQVLFAFGTIGAGRSGRGDRKPDEGIKECRGV